MPLVEQYKGRRIWKAKRPEWQDVKPITPEGKDTYKIAAKYEPRFAGAWLDSVKRVLPGDAPKEFKAAIEQQSSVKAFEALAPYRDKALGQFRQDIEEQYAAVMQESGDEATEDLNREFKTKLRFSIAKAMEDVREAAKDFIVPVNPYSIEWMKNRSLELVKDFEKKQTDTIQQILTRNFEEGMRAELVYDDIKANIGLLPREEKAVRNRMELMIGEGYSPPEIKAHAAWYREQLLKKRAERIARTETISAQAQGRLDSWRVANESGRLPPVVREWSAPPPGPSPQRPCKICIDLHGRPAELNGSYESNYLGSVEAPPAHPHCRCTEVLVRAEE